MAKQAWLNKAGLLTIFVTAMSLAPVDAADKPAGAVASPVNRYPQAIRAGDLQGRLVLEPKESQPVLGHVVAAVRNQNGDAALVVRLSGWLQLDLFGTREVLVPIDDLAVLGEHVAALDIKPEALEALPTFEQGSATPVAADDTLRMGIVGPFH